MNPSNVPSPDPEPHDDKDKGAGKPEREKADLRLNFTFSEFVPDVSSPLGRALLGHLQQRAELTPKFIKFNSTYSVELMLPDGTSLYETPQRVRGFLIGLTPSGTPTVLQMLSEDGRKIRIPVVVVEQCKGGWSVIPSPLGWNSEVLAASQSALNGSKRLSFPEAGVFLVTASEDKEGMFSVPLLVSALSVQADGIIKHAYSGDGRKIKPPKPEPSLDLAALPPAPANSDDQGYSLQAEIAPIKESINTRAVQGATQTNASPARSKIEIHAQEMELALRHLFQQEMKGQKHGPAVKEIMLKAFKNSDSTDTPLSDLCGKLVLSAGSNERANAVATLCRKWLTHHYERSTFKELFWPSYYQDLHTIAPLLTRLEGDLTRVEAGMYRGTKKGKSD